MFEKDEYVVATFWRTANGHEIMHVYGGYGVGETGKTKALWDRGVMLREYRLTNPTGPLPVIKAVKVSTQP